jgi:pyruvate,water dikinase
MNGMFVKFLNEIKEPKVSELGGKGYSLAVLTNNGFNVPRGFIIISRTFFEYLRQNDMMERIQELSSEINENNFEEKGREIRNLILSGKIQENIESEVKEALSKLNANYVSVRSSAVSEDSLKASFAGLHDTFLNVKVEVSSVLENVKKCWASLFNDRAVIYRIKKGIPHLEGMAVIVQEMIPANISGITFTFHPMNEKAMLIEFAPGLGDKVVSGEIIPTTVVINRENLTIIEKKYKKEKIMPKNILIKLAKICLKIESVFNSPQDIEWCISKNSIWILQSRPITILSPSTEGKSRMKTILNGLGASPGIVKGKVKIILNPKEIGKINKGEILVTVMTNPLYITAIEKAGAIVTDVGGMICHAAIISRELGIPCVVGTGNATKILKDNMEVIVDGTKGKVYLSN